MDRRLSEQGPKQAQNYVAHILKTASALLSWMGIPPRRPEAGLIAPNLPFPTRQRPSGSSTIALPDEYLGQKRVRPPCHLRLGGSAPGRAGEDRGDFPAAKDPSEVP